MERGNSLLSLLPVVAILVPFTMASSALAQSRPQGVSQAPVFEGLALHGTPAAVTIPPAPRPNDPPKPKKPGIQVNQA